ncbi:agmatinase family protein [Parvularcula lutaonensis]|uniref:Agmatinase family protein n=1 Tax=Parvularcula lutaonensis TaxID=491923 RepID=A0ABV7M8W6_9PROT|nr:agmatinase family protein [Parvularcula lutaonensis]
MHRNLHTLLAAAVIWPVTSLAQVERPRDAEAPAPVATEAGEKPVELPRWLERRLEDAPEELREFFLSDEGVGAYPKPERLFEKLKPKTREATIAYIEGMKFLADEAKFDPETDMASIPLNTDSSSFNSWKVMRPKEMDPEREPGPININYYASSRFGIATFAGAPVAVYPEDLEAGNVDVAIVGAPLDMGSGYRGQRYGPQAMRAVYGMVGEDMATMIAPEQVLTIVDYGDIAVDNMSTEISVHHVRERVREIANAGAVPFIVGGDHSLEYPNVAALADVHGKKSFGVIHFDAHYDAGRGRAHWITHGQPVYRLVKEGHVDPASYIQVGLRGPWPGPDGFEWMRNNGMRYHTMAEVEKKGWDTVMTTALREAREGGKPIYISFDVDVLDPAYMVGTGTPVPGGLTMREAIPLIRGLCAENEILGFEIVEVAPMLDPTYATALNANFIVHACLTGMAMRKEGFDDAGYYSDLTTEHRQPEAGELGKAEGKQVEVDEGYAWSPPGQRRAGPLDEGGESPQL